MQLLFSIVSYNLVCLETLFTMMPDPNLLDSLCQVSVLLGVLLADPHGLSSLEFLYQIQLLALYCFKVPVFFVAE